jgi:hypothetical protein
MGRGTRLAIGVQLVEPNATADGRVWLARSGAERPPILTGLQLSACPPWPWLIP